MSYVVLARKYRPQSFDDMVGQEHVGRTLGNAIRQERVHHAYLFAGARGLGKTTTARIFAKGLVCETGPTADPCNACEQCRSVNEGRSVDVLEIDGASNNSVENIRNLREQVHYLPQTARRKVYIIDEVHMLTTSAFNALLKTLEEPPAHVNFIFATTEPQKVLPTILSRVSRLDFRRISTEEGVGHLRTILGREGLAVDEGGLRLIARAAGGSVRDCLTLLDQVLAFADDPKAVTEDEARRVLGQADRTAVSGLVAAVLAREPDHVVSRLDALVASGLDLMVLSLQILEHLRDLTLASVCQTRAALGDVTDGEYEDLRAAASAADPSVYGQFFDRFSRVVDRLPSSRVQRLLVEMALLELAHSEPVVPLGELVAQLHALAGTQDPGPSGGTPPAGRASSSRTSSPRGTPPSSSASPPIPRAMTGRDTARSETRSEEGQPRAGDPLTTASPSSTSRHAHGHALPDAIPRPVDAPSDGGSRLVDAPFDAALQCAPVEAPAVDAVPAASLSNIAATDRLIEGSPSADPVDGSTLPRSAVHDVSAHRSPLVDVRDDAPSAFPVAPAAFPGLCVQTSAAPGSASAVRDSSAHPSPLPDVRHAASASPVAEAQEDVPNDAFLGSPLMEGLWKMAQGTVFAKDVPDESPTPVLDRPVPPDPPTPAPDSSTACMSGCLEAPVRDDVIDLDRLPQFEAWVALVDRIRKEDEYVSAVLSDVGLVSLADGALRVAAPLRSFAHNELSQRPEIRAQVEQATRDHFGRPFQLELVEGEAALPDRPSIMLVDAQRRENHRRNVEAEARQNGAIRSVLDVFRAQLTATRPLQDLPQ